MVASAVGARPAAMSAPGVASSWTKTAPAIGNPEKRRQRAGRAGERGLALVEPVAPRERRAADGAGGDHGRLGPDAEARRGRQQRRREQRADGARARGQGAAPRAAAT